MNPIVETPIDVTPPKFKPGDRIIVVDDKTTGRNGSVGTIARVWRSTPLGFSYTAILDGETLLGGIPFHPDEIKPYVEPTVSRRVLQIADELAEAHTAPQVIGILQDYRLI